MRCTSLFRSPWPSGKGLCALALACTVASAATARAEANLADDLRRALEAGRPTLGMEWDNDAFGFSRDDGSYSNGVRFTLRYASPDTHTVRRDDGTTSLQRHVYGLRLGQHIYTPSDIDLPPAALPPAERPYAGYLYLGASRDTFWSEGNGGRYLRLALDVGCIGPCSGAEELQRAVHGWVGSSEPQGWSQQIRNEPTLQLSAEYSPGRWVFGSWADAAPYVRGQLGNVFVTAGAGATVRVGRFNAPFTGTWMNAPGRGLAAGAGASAWAPEHATELFAYARIEARYVAHNATIEGGWFNDSPRTLDAEPFVVESEVGIAWAGERWMLGYAMLWRSQEIESQSDSLTAHRWGRIQIGYRFD